MNKSHRTGNKEYKRYSFDSHLESGNGNRLRTHLNDIKKKSSSESWSFHFNETWFQKRCQFVFDLQFWMPLPCLLLLYILNYWIYTMYICNTNHLLFGLLSTLAGWQMVHISDVLNSALLFVYTVHLFHMY